MNVLVLQHSRLGEPGLIGDAMAERGVAADIRLPHEGDPLPDSPNGYDGLVLLGGVMSANDDAAHPHFPALLKLIHRFDGADRPVLGVCLGAQLIARAWGGRVHPHDHVEIGYLHQSRTEAAADDPLMCDVPAEFPIMQWHQDTFTLPANAVLLATSPGCRHQAFRLGARIWAFQFHFEVTRRMAEAWMEEYARQRGADGDEVRRHGAAQIATHAPAAIKVGRQLAEAWLDVVERSV